MLPMFGYSRIQWQHVLWKFIETCMWIWHFYRLEFTIFFKKKIPFVLFSCNWLRCYYDEPVLWIIFSIKFWFVGYLDRWASRFILSRLVECVCIHEYDSEFNWEYDLNLILVSLNEIDAIMMHTHLNSSFNFFGLWISMMCTDVLKAGGKRSGSTKYERRFRATHICFTGSRPCQVLSLQREP